jgi:hypothetical protein
VGPEVMARMQDVSTLDIDLQAYSAAISDPHKQSHLGLRTLTSKLSHHISVGVSKAKQAGVAYPDVMINTSQRPIAPATARTRGSSQRSTTYTSDTVVCSMRRTVCWSRPKWRPSRATLAAPAWAKATAVSRPIRLPCETSAASSPPLEHCSYPSGNDNCFTCHAEGRTSRRDRIVSIVAPSRRGTRQRRFHGEDPYTS